MNDALQTVLTALIVLGAALYAAWVLMPAAWRRGLARRLGRPAPAGGACGGCDGCGDARPAPGAPQVIRIQRRP